jgi:hypothetical protein
VTFSDNGSVVGSGSLAVSGGKDIATATLNGLQPGANNLTASYAGDGNFALSSGATTDTVGSTSTISGTYPGSLIVGSGQSVLITGTVKGSVSVTSGGSVAIEGGSVLGSLAASGANSITLCGASISGAVSISGSHGFVELGGAGCKANTILGPVSLSSNTGGVEVAGSKISGATSVTNNTGYLPVQQNNVYPPTEISGNTISGSLACSGNVPAPTDGGQANKSTSRSGQCSAAKF